METFTLWSHQAMLASYIMEAQCPRGESHLPMEPFTLDSHILDPSTLIDAPEGHMAPCTNSVYKAAHRRISFVGTVSPSESRAALLVIANLEGTPFYCLNKFCDFHSRSSPTPYLRQRMILNGFTGKGLNKMAHALNGNHISWQIPVPHYRSKLWKDSFTIPNGMIIFDYSFYGKDKLWIKFYRRG